MKAIVHIGMRKTGSTTLQAYLFQNKQALASQGFRYHLNASRHRPQWEYPFAALAQVNRLPRGHRVRVTYGARTVEEARRTTEPAITMLKTFPNVFSEPVALFSSEFITDLLDATDAIEAFDSLFAEVFDETHYVMYFRQPSEFILSEHSLRVRNGWDDTLDELIDAEKNRASLFETANQWASVVGRERLTVRLFDPDFMVDGDLLSDFCAVCGIEPTGMQQVPRMNEALTHTGVEVLRALNTKVSVLRSDETRNPSRTALPHRVSELTTDGPKLAFLPQQLERVEQAVRGDMEQLRRSFFPDRERLFTTTPRTTTEADLLRVRLEASEVLAQLHVDLLEGRLTPTKERLTTRVRRAVRKPLRSIKHRFLKPS